MWNYLAAVKESGEILMLDGIANAGLQKIQ